MDELISAAKNIGVLIVDDAPSIRSLLVAIVQSFGIKNISEAGDGAAALQVLNSKGMI